MSLFDEDDSEQWYDTHNKFEENVLKNAQRADMHPLAYLLKKQIKALDTLQEFSEQEPLLSKSEQIAVESDAEEAREALERAAEVMPSVVEEQ